MSVFMIIALLSTVGFLLSGYAYYMERRLLTDPTFKPFCDISDRFSCSKPIVSEYNKLIGISNALAGMLAYLLLMVCALFEYETLITAALALSLVSTALLAYILYGKVKSFCLICSTLYLINILMCIVWFL